MSAAGYMEVNYDKFYLGPLKITCTTRTSAG